MSRGLGSLQRDIKEVLAKTVDDCGPLGIADLWQWLIARAGGGREDALRPARERSLRRAIKGLVFRGEILEPISKSSEEDDEAGELDKAEEVLSVVLPADEYATLPLYPGEEALDEPAPLVTA